MDHLSINSTFGLLRPTPKAIGKCMGKTYGCEIMWAAKEIRPFARLSQRDFGQSAHSLLHESWKLDIPRVVVAVVGDRCEHCKLSSDAEIRLKESLRVMSNTDSIWFITSGWELGCISNMILLRCIPYFLFVALYLYSWLILDFYRGSWFAA